MLIGIISDTHSHLPADVFKEFSNVDIIFHAGDIGDDNIITELGTLAPVEAVYGNIDTWPVVSKYQRLLFKSIDSVSICLIHDIVSIKYFQFELFKKNIKPDIVISGHTHIPGFEYFNNILYINPGSASRPKQNKLGSVALINIEGGQIAKPEFRDINWR